MDSKAATIELEELLSQSAWIRALAQSLLPNRDAAAADDAAQDAWLAAWRRTASREGSLRPWLRGILRKGVLQQGREEARRRRRQRAAARPEATPSTAELVERAELQKKVAEAVVDLAEPYRTTVLLRYFEGLSSAEIARRLEEPAGTVRSRLKRGLELLRTRLDNAFGGDRERWCCLLAAFPLGRSGAPAASGGVPVLAGLLAMAKGWLLACALAAVVPVLIGVWILGDGPGGSSVPGPGNRAPSAGTIEPRAASTVPALGVSRIDLPSAPAEEAPLDAAGPFEEWASVEARLVDERGGPLAGAMLRLVHKEVVFAEGVSGADGKVHVEVLLPGDGWPAPFEASYPGRETRLVRVVLIEGPVLLGDIALAPAGSVSGRVEDSDGVAVAGSTIRVSGLDSSRRDPGELRRKGPLPDRSLPQTDTDVTGRFHLAGLRAGEWLLWAGRKGKEWSSAGPLAIVRDQELSGLVLVLDDLHRDDSIEGIVLSPEGAPVAGARVEYDYLIPGSVMASSGILSDPDGCFSLLLDRRVPHSFGVTDPQNRWSAVEVEDVPPGARDVVLRFREASWVEVFVRDERGQAVEEFALTCQKLAGGRHTDAEGVPFGRHEEGYALQRVPHYEFWIRVDAPGFAIATLGPFSPEATPATLEAVLTGQPGVRGRVISGSSPVPGAEVELHRVIDGARIWARGFPCLFFGKPDSRTHSGADGSFHLALRAPGLYMVRATAEGFVPGESGLIELDPAHGIEEVTVSLGQGGAIEGQVFAGPGEEPAGLIVGINHGDGQPRSTRVNVDGTYRFEGLIPGSWQVRLRNVETAADGGFGRSPGEGRPEIDWDCDVWEGETTRFDLCVETVERAALHGHLDLAGADLSGWAASLWQSNQGDVERIHSQLSPEGSFLLAQVLPGYRELTLVGPPTGCGRFTLSEWIDVEPGQAEWTLLLSAGSITGEGAPVGEGSEVALELRVRPAGNDHPNLEAHCRIIPDAAGRFELPLVPAGVVELRRFDPRQERSRDWETLLEFTLAAGDARHVVVP